MKTIYAIPGLGTTKDLFKNIKIPNYELKILDWPTTLPGYTLRDYSSKFIEQIDCSYPVNLIGVSFGGMLCSELSNQIKTNKVVLISSCKDISEFPTLLKFLRIIPVHKLVSDNFFKFLAKLKLKTSSQNKIIYEMLFEMKEHYLSHCINYIINWDRKISESNFIRIHGTADRLLLQKYIVECEKVEGGSHTMILDRSNEINKILNNQFNGL